MAHDQQLGLIPELVHEIEEAVKVDVVQRRFHLVEQVKGRGATAEDRKQEGERGQTPPANSLILVRYRTTRAATGSDLGKRNAPTTMTSPCFACTTAVDAEPQRGS